MRVKRFTFIIKSDLLWRIWEKSDLATPICAAGCQRSLFTYKRGRGLWRCAAQIWHRWVTRWPHPLWPERSARSGSISFDKSRSVWICRFKKNATNASEYRSNRWIFIIKFIQKKGHGRGQLLASQNVAFQEVFSGYHHLILTASWLLPYTCLFHQLWDSSVF